MAITKVRKSTLEDSYWELTNYLGDVTRNWLSSPVGIGDNTTDGSSTDYPALRIQRDVNHTGGTQGGSVNSSALSVATNVNKTSGRVDNYENAIVAACYSYRDDVLVSAPNITAFQGGTFKYNNSTGGFFGSNFVARDETGNESSISRGGLVATEIDVVASGPDDANTRIVCEVIARAFGPHASAASTYAGVRIRPSNGSSNGSPAVPMTIKNAIVVDEGTLGSVENGLLINSCTKYGVQLGPYDVSAGFTHALIKGSAGSGSLEIGSNRSDVSGNIGTINFTGKNSVGEVVAYSNLFTTISSNIDGIEHGTFSLAVRGSGSIVTALQVRGNTSSNPVYLNIGGSLQQVSAGVNDSAGAGYRLLRVANV